MVDKYQFFLNKRSTHGINIAQINRHLYEFFMKKTIKLMALMLIFMLPALTTTAYAESHAKADVATDADKKKPTAEEEDEEPDCD